MDLKIEVKHSDITEVAVDVVILKYAQDFWGADKLVANKLTKSRKEIRHNAPKVGEYLILQTFGKINARYALFIGTTRLQKFRYGKIREFSKEAMKIIKSELPDISTVAMTMHGVSYGLDEEESFLSQLGGLLDALREDLISTNLKKIIVVEKNLRRAQRIEALISEHVPNYVLSKEKIVDIDAGHQSETKPHIFVAMPYEKRFDDVYEFGIETPIKTTGLVCERVDETSFTGDILDRIKLRIDTSSAVIADLSGANPNVYLEVGYAWGKKRPTILLVEDPIDLRFDVRGQRCIIYETIGELKRKLERELQVILP